MPIQPEKKIRANLAATFWPRPEDYKSRGVTGEFDVDRACPGCGYNLRGLPPRTRCPECGSAGGMFVPDEPIPFDEHPTAWSFLRTIGQALFTPAYLARHVWRPDWIEPTRARRFRRVMLWFATVVLSLTMYQFCARMIGPRAALAALVVQAPAIIVWLNGVTMIPMRLVRQAMPVRGADARARAIAHYLPAALIVLPVQLLLIPTVTGYYLNHAVFNVPGWLFSAGMHLFVLFVQLIPMSVGSGWLFYELVDVRPSIAQLVGLRVAILGGVSATLMLVAIPALAALLASHALQ